MIKSLVKTSLAVLGYEVHKLSPHKRRSRAGKLSVKVGKFSISVPASSLLPDIFAVNPDYSSELGRLVGVASTKYPDLRMIDVGANFGDSVAIAKSAADIPVLCVEGDENCLSLLEQNIEQFQDVTIHKVLLGERSETISVAFEKQGWNLTLIPGQQDSSVKVDLITLDDFLKPFDPVNFKLLKIDTEGFDCKIVRGGLDYIRNVTPLITLEYNRDNMTRISEDGITTLLLLRDLGYEVVLFYDGQGRLVTSARLSDEDVIRDLHEYANGRDGAIYYYDLCLFHRNDEDLALAFQQSERERIRRGVRPRAAARADS